MAGRETKNVPSWVAEVKEYATKTNEWTDLTRSIHEAVDQHLNQNHVSYFSDLSEAEKSLLLERAARSLSEADQGRVYDHLQAKLSYLLDQSVNNQVAKKLVEENPLDTKTDLVLDTTSEGIVALLRKHPEQKYKLRIFLNQSMPPGIRFVAFQLYFSNYDQRKIFVGKLAMNPKQCLSIQDPEIQKKCEKLLNSAVSFKEMRESRGYLNCMKGILSYYHTTLNSSRPLSETEYYLSLPVVYTHFPPLPKFDAPTEKSMVALVEIFLTFIESLPSAVKMEFRDTNAPVNGEMDLMIQSTFTILDKYDSGFWETMKELATASGVSGIEDVNAQGAYKPILTNMIKKLFSGYLNLECLMFVWDQYVIGSDVSGYYLELIPVITAIILMIIRDQLMAAISIREFEECLKNQTCFIQARQIQTLLNKYFFKSLQIKLNNVNRFGPVIDPTVGRMQPWEHWHQDVIPRRTTRSRENELREEDEKLKAELNRRLEKEKESKEEIERLRKELENLRGRPGEPKSIKVSQRPALDILLKVKNSIDLLTHGQGFNRRSLDRETSEDLKFHKEDLKIAEKQVFGHFLAPNEWDKLSEREKKMYSERMLEVVTTRLDHRLSQK